MTTPRSENRADLRFDRLNLVGHVLGAAVQARQQIGFNLAVTLIELNEEQKSSSRTRARHGPTQDSGVLSRDARTNKSDNICALCFGQLRQLLIAD